MLIMFLLKSYRNPIPGNYSYAQTEGIIHEFAAQPEIESVAKSVSAFRIANKLPRASLSESFKDVSQYQCQRLGNDPNYCFECPDGEFESHHRNHPLFSPPCATCGKPVTS